MQDRWLDVINQYGLNALFEAVKTDKTILRYVDTDELLLTQVLEELAQTSTEAAETLKQIREMQLEIEIE